MNKGLKVKPEISVKYLRRDSKPSNVGNIQDGGIHLDIIRTKSVFKSIGINSPEEKFKEQCLLRNPKFGGWVEKRQ